MIKGLGTGLQGSTRQGVAKSLAVIPALSVTTDVTLNKSLRVSGSDVTESSNLNNSNGKSSPGCCEDPDVIQLDEIIGRKAF